MIYPLHHVPGPTRLSSGDWLCTRGARIKRLDPQPVIGSADQALFEIGALERGLDQLAPLRLRHGWEFGSETEFVGHGSKMPQSARWSHRIDARCIAGMRRPLGQPLDRSAIHNARRLVDTSPGDHAVARDLRQRDQNESAFEQARVRQREVGSSSVTSS